jgi:hypothetical protein
MMTPSRAFSIPTLKKKKGIKKNERRDRKRWEDTEEETTIRKSEMDIHIEEDEVDGLITAQHLTFSNHKEQRISDLTSST